MAEFMRGIQRYLPHKLSTLSYNFAIAMCKYTYQIRCPDSTHLAASALLLKKNEEKKHELQQLLQHWRKI